MERNPTPQQLAFETKVVQRARRFELKPLLKLLEARGYRRGEILFQSSLGGTSPSLVESVEFDRSRSRPFVLITVNIGLLGDNSLLPSYFFKVVEPTNHRDRFYDFLRFFDHRLIENLLRGLYPEDDTTLFQDWGKAKESLLKTLGLGSTSTLQWLVQLYFPELRVHVERLTFATETESHAMRPGHSPLDGSNVLGHLYAANAEGFLIDLIADEEVNARGRSWATIARERLKGKADASGPQGLLHRLAPFQIPVVVRLKVLEHASWALLEGDGASRGYLGYDRLQDDKASVHTIVVYPEELR